MTFLARLFDFLGPWILFHGYYNDWLYHGCAPCFTTAKIIQINVKSVYILKKPCPTTISMKTISPIIFDIWDEFAKSSFKCTTVLVIRWLFWFHNCFYFFAFLVSRRRAFIIIQHNSHLSNVMTSNTNYFMSLYLRWGRTSARKIAFIRGVEITCPNMKDIDNETNELYFLARILFQW